MRGIVTVQPRAMVEGVSCGDHDGHHRRLSARLA